VSLLGILRGLDAAGVRFVVIGGMAGQLHGSSRLTNDVDICYDTAPDNLAVLATVLQRWRAYPRDIEPGLPFTLDARALHSSESLTLTTVEGNLDLFAHVPGVGRYREALAQSLVFDLDGVRVLTLTLNALIASKIAAGRPKDREHVIELEALRDVASQRDAE
jgi:predicted nucleotidyltransferase